MSFAFVATNAASVPGMKLSQKIEAAPEQRVWVIGVPGGDFQTIADADDLQIESACLVFRKGARIILALAPGQWVSVHDDVQAQIARDRVS